ncbi:hypothetical protein GR138_12915 [Shinella kummerowiae]|uniref:Uncharacterized protein n=1 Tax=Shinella kummerowiae TaxID=417745 RepID=A0A6N8SGS6_9HYPH|nr:hypothetical protein [Shinella kummerowiae]MXN46092.1 hypothetical protein [Shinella kummerowiae]
MATNATAIDQIKTLKNDAAKLGTFHEWFAETFADKAHHDKQAFGFGVGTGEYFAFKSSVWFYAYCGQYGSSSVYSQLSVQDSKAVNAAFTKALNRHQKLIFQTMAEIMTDEATKLRDQAQKEVSALQSMLHDLDTPQTSEAT